MNLKMNLFKKQPLIITHIIPYVGDPNFLTIRFKKNHHLKPQKKLVLTLNGSSPGWVKVLRVDSKKEIFIRKQTAALYLFSTPLHRKENLHKLGSSSWQYTINRIKQQDNSAVAEELEREKEFKLDDNISETEVLKIERECRNRLNLYRKNREWVQNTLQECIEVMSAVIKEYGAEKTYIYDVFSLRYYQDARRILAREHYKKYNKGWYYSFCGTGKSFDSFVIYTDLLVSGLIKNPNGILISMEPSKQLIYEIKEKLNKIAGSSNYPDPIIHTIFDENPDAKIENIVSALKNSTTKNNVLTIILCTYQSYEKLSIAIKIAGIIPDFIFYDECHTLTGSASSFWVNSIKDDVLPAKKKCFATASPIEYEYISDQIFGMNDERYFGKCFDGYTYREAVKDGYITPIKMFSLIISIKDNIAFIIKSILDDNSIVSIPELGLGTIDLENTTIFAIQLHTCLMGMILGHWTHPIFFTNTVARAEYFIKWIKLLAKDPRYNLKELNEENCISLDGSMPAKDRIKLLNGKWAKAKYAIVANAKCLSMGIDISVIDGIGFIDPRTSIPDIIQIIGRCVRLHPNKKFSSIIFPFITELSENGNPIYGANCLARTRDIVTNIISSDESIEKIILDENYVFETNEKLKSGITVKKLPSGIKRAQKNPMTGGTQVRKIPAQKLSDIIIAYDKFVDCMNIIEIQHSYTQADCSIERYLTIVLFEYTINIKNHLKVASKEFKRKHFHKYTNYIKTNEEHITAFSQISCITEENSKILLNRFFKEIENPQKELTTKMQKLLTKEILGII